MLIRGSVYIHSCPAALKHHVEWSLQSILGNSVSLSWRTQPLMAGTFRCEISWREKTSKASQVATALRSWHYLRFEVRDESDNGGDFFRFTPELGIHRASIDGTGSILINENQITAALEKSFDEEALRAALQDAMGTKWELELEPLRAVDMQERSHLQAI